MQIALFRKKYFLSISTLILLMSSQISKAGDWTIAPEVGRGKVEIKSKFSLSGNTTPIESTVVNFVIDYKFDSNVVIEASLSSAFSDNFFGALDDYRLYSYNLSVGYEFEVNDRFRVVPRIGVSDWELKAKEGRFLNPGGESEFRYSGNDSFGKINLEFTVNKRFGIYLAYMETKMDVGQFKSGQVDFRFSL